MDYAKYEYVKERISRFQHVTGSICKVKSLPVDDVMNALVDSLLTTIADFELKVKNDGNNSEYERHQAMVVAMETELKKQENRKRKLLDSWESDDGMYTKDEFLERKRMYDGTIEQLKSKIQEEKRNGPEPIDYAEKITTLHAMIDCIRNPELSAQDKNDFLKSFIDRIEYDAIDLGYRKGGKAVLDVFFK